MSTGPGLALAIRTTSHGVLKWGRCVSDFSASPFSISPTPPHPQEGHVLTLLIAEVCVEDPLWGIHSSCTQGALILAERCLTTHSTWWWWWWGAMGLFQDKCSTVERG